MTNPPSEPDDPRLTAYALGELDDSAERAAVERLLDASPAARAEFEQTRALAATLTAEYAEEQAVYQSTHAGTIPNVVPFPAPVRRTGKSWTNLALKIAAVFVVFAGLAFGAKRWREKRPGLATTNPSAALPLATAAPVGTVLDTLPPPRPATQTDGNPVPPADDSVALTAAQPPAIEAPLAPVPGTPAETPDARLADNAPGGSAGAQSAVRRAEARSPMPKTATATPSPTAIEQRIAAALVRIRRQDGSSVDGVVLAPGGLVLTPDFVPPSGEQETFQAVTGAGTFQAVFLMRLGPGRACLFETDAHGLTAAPLADPSHFQAGSLVLAGFRGETGKVGFERVSTDGRTQQAGNSPELVAGVPAGGAATFRLVFDAAGGFLSAEPLPPVERSRGSGKLQSFRLLSPEDRDLLAPLIEARAH